MKIKVFILSDKHLFYCHKSAGVFDKSAVPEGTMPRAKNKTEHDGVFVVYSASGSSSGGYWMGMLSFNGGEILDSNNWTKSRTKVYGNSPLKSLYNAGHCSFLYRENGGIYMVYHATQKR